MEFNLSGPLDISLQNISLTLQNLDFVLVFNFKNIVINYVIELFLVFFTFELLEVSTFLSLHTTTLYCGVAIKNFNLE